MQISLNDFFLRTLQLFPHCLQIKPKLPDIIEEAPHGKAHWSSTIPQPCLTSPTTSQHQASSYLSIFAFISSAWEILFILFFLTKFYSNI